jgi:hypothetical protein
MKRQDTEYWEARIREQEKLGISAAEYCRRRSLQRGTFLRWRRRIAGRTDVQELVEIAATKTHGGAGYPAALSIRLERGILIRFHELPDAEVVALLVSAIRAGSAT